MRDLCNIFFLKTFLIIPAAAGRYEGRIKDGGILLSVHSDDSAWTKKAKEILERTGAQDVSSTGEATADKDDKARVREVA